MGVLSRAWSAGARLRRSPGDAAWEEGRRGWVRAHAAGRSFLDVGGLYKLVGDVAFLAEEAGATLVTLLDVGDPDLICEGHPEWGWLEQKTAERGSKLRYVQGDLEDPATPERVGVHDVVFFSGVLYHSPNPVLQLVQLRAMTGELAYVSTLTIPEIPGFPQACTFYPYLDEADRRPYAAGYSWASDLLGIGQPVDDRPMFGYGNCWWGISRSALGAMLRAARFEVVEERPRLHRGFVTELVVRPLPLDPLLPPVTYFRERSEARERDGTRLPFDSWYDQHPR